MNRTRSPQPSPPVPAARTRGLTVGAILGAIAVIAVLVVILMLLWRPGTAPATDPDPSGAPSVEGPADPGDLGEGEGLEEGAGAGDDATDAAEDIAAEGEDAADDAAGAAEDAADDANLVEEGPTEEDAGPADGDAAGEGADPDAAEDEPADDGAAPDDEPEASVDATVQPEAEAEVRTDPMQRVADMGGEVAAATEAVTSAIGDTQSRLEGLRTAPPEEDSAPSLEPSEPGASSGTRVRDAEVPALAERLDRAVSGVSQASRTSREEGTAQVSLGEVAARSDAGEARVRTVPIGGAGAVSLGDSVAAQTRSAPGGGGAAVDVGGTSAEADPAARTVSPDVESLRQVAERLEQDLRGALDTRSAAPADESR